jgi:hypothetical protein
MRVRPSRVRRLRIRKAIGNATLAATVLVVGTLYLTLEKQVTLVVDGQPQAVRTLSANVGDLLDSSGIVLGRDDVVVPPAATPWWWPRCSPPRPNRLRKVWGPG